MKTTLTAFLILTALIGGSFWSHQATQHTCAEFDQNLSIGYRAALSRDWTFAEQTFKKIQTDWEEQKTLLAAFTHHSLLEDVQRALSRVIVTIQARDNENMQLEIASLKESLSALRNSDTARLENIF